MSKINIDYKTLKNAIVYILCNKNNVIISVTNNGNVILSKSSGTKFHGNQKTTPFASQSTMQDIVNLIKEKTKITDLSLVFRGYNLNNVKELIIKPIIGNLNINSISIDCNLPHGGCRPKKKRRI